MCTCHGSLPALRTGTNPAPRRTATGAAMMKPRASTPMTLSIGALGEGVGQGRHAPATGPVRWPAAG